MAAVIQISKAVGLLNEARNSGLSLLWIEGNAIALGFAPSHTELRLDLISESLVSEPNRRPAGNGCTEQTGAACAGKNASRVLSRSEGGRRTGHYSVSIDGARHDATSQKSLLLVALAAIERARPGTLEKLSQEKGRTKRIVARNRDNLHANPILGRKFGVRLNDEWWLTTNNSFAETQRFIRRAAWHAGMTVDIQPQT